MLVHWLPTTVEEAYDDVFDAKPKNDPMIKARIQLLAHLLSLCHFGDGDAFAPITIDDLTKTPAEWATYLIELYNEEDYDRVYYFADVLNNWRE